MLFFDRAIRRRVAQNQVHLVGGAALVRAKHDGEGRRFHQRFGRELVVGRHQLKVGAAARDAVGQFEVVLKRQAVGRGDGGAELGGEAVVFGGVGGLWMVMRREGVGG